MILTLSRVARAYARSRRDIHQDPSVVRYAQGGGASVPLGPVGGGVPVLSDLSDWRSFPARREARRKAAVALIEESLQEALIMHDDTTRRQMMMALVALTADLPVGVER